MFGYVLANFDILAEEDKKTYREYYCGLCHSLGKRHGQLSRLTLSYDITFLVLILASLRGSNSDIRSERCLPHMLKPHDFISDEISDYAADMTIVLSYYNFMDDWNDDKSLTALEKASLLKKSYLRIEAEYPEKCRIIASCLSELSRIEADGILNPDIPANCFGRLMGEIFAYGSADNQQDLRLFGESLGRFIYIMDAAVDLKRDLKKKKYNPLIPCNSDDFREILNLLMSDCTECFCRLKLLLNKDLIENILYSGVWTKFELAKRRSEGAKLNDIRSL